MPCNPSYSRGSDRRILSLRPVQEKGRRILSQKQKIKTKLWCTAIFRKQRQKYPELEEATGKNKIKTKGWGHK
jgi:hypothetical protein